MSKGESIIRECLGMAAAFEQWPDCYKKLAGRITMLRCKHVNAALRFRHLQRLAAEKEKVAA